MTTGGVQLSKEQQATIRHAFDRDEYRPLFDAVRSRLESAGEKPARSVLLRGLRPEERRAIAELHGWAHIPPESVRVNLERLDTVLRNSRIGVGLAGVVESLGGPIVDRRGQERLAARTLERMWEEVREHDAMRDRPELGQWLDELRAHGLLKRAARKAKVDAADMLLRALDIVARLPCIEGVPLSVLATEATGDAHSLDSGRPLTALILRAAARLAGRTAVPSSATERRALWAAVGVHCDALSCHVLVAGLRPNGDERLQRHLRESAACGEPSRVTLRELTRCSLAVPSGTNVFVCENPAVVAVAADRLGAACAPLVCVEGIPSTAAWHLLGSLTSHGARLRFHADFDWDGIRIGNLLRERLSAGAWRFDHRDYRTALAAGSPENPLSGAPVSAGWDPELTRAMHQSRRAVSEESVVENLLEDLEEPRSSTLRSGNHGRPRTLRPRATRRPH